MHNNIYKWYIGEHTFKNFTDGVSDQKSLETNNKLDLRYRTLHDQCKEKHQDY